MEPADLQFIFGQFQWTYANGHLISLNLKHNVFRAPWLVQYLLFFYEKDVQWLIE